MQFNFNCEAVLDCDENGFAILQGSCQNRIIPGYRIYVKEILDTMGELSSKSQNLQTIITNTNSFFPSNYTLFIKADNNVVFGYIKLGLKKLFLKDRLFNFHERTTLCVLDFYVYESVQRRGIGKELFDFMLNFENTRADLLAYDRPSSRLYSFLKKNYGLDNHIPQNNSFIIFDNFFSPNVIPNNDTEFDNDTYRVIQSLRTPEYLNTSNYQSQTYNMKRYMSNSNLSRHNYDSKRYDNNNNYIREEKLRNRNYINNNNNNKNNITEIDNNGPRALSPIGNQLVYSNDFRNTVVNKDVYKNPNTGFQKYYLNKEDSLAYDNIYSKKKLNLINDYMASKKQSPYDYIQEQNNINENSINYSNQRQNELNDKISYIKNNNRYKDDELYNKRYNYATLFDDKKLAEHEYLQQNQNVNRSQDFINEREYQNHNYPRYQNAYNNEKPRSPQVYKSDEFISTIERQNRNIKYNDN